MKERWFSMVFYGVARKMKKWSLWESSGSIFCLKEVPNHTKTLQSLTLAKTFSTLFFSIARILSQKQKYKLDALDISWKANTYGPAFSSDVFLFKQMTKRTIPVTSWVVFDPFGWIAPVVNVFKCLIQQTCIEAHSW